LRDRVISALLRSGKEVEGRLAGTSHRKVAALLAGGGMTKAINPPKKGEAKKLRPLFEELTESVLVDGAEEALSSLGVGVTFDPKDKRVQAWLGDRLDMFSEEVSGTSFEAIDRVLRAGFAEGQSLPVIADELRTMFAAWDKYRAPLIARTETVSALNRGSLEGVRQSGVADELKKGWLTAGDEQVRDTHVAAGVAYGKSPIPVDEDFSVGADSMPHPGGGSLAEENINCRCAVSYVRKKKS